MIVPTVVAFAQGFHEATCLSLTLGHQLRSTAEHQAALKGHLRTLAQNFQPEVLNPKPRAPNQERDLLRVISDRLFAQQGLGMRLQGLWGLGST